MSNWATATASYENRTCVLRVSGTVIGTLPIYYNYLPTPAPGATIVIGYKAVRDDGQVMTFRTDGTSIVAPPSIALRLEKTSNGYRLTDTNDNVEQYGSDGRLLSVMTRGGVVNTLSYDSANRLSGVTDTFGREISLGYDAQGRLSSVTDPGPNNVQYGYDTQNRLSTVSALDATTQTYLYENASFPNALTGRRDENGTLYSTWSYDAQGRATDTTEAGGAESVHLDYNSDGTVTVTDALGAVRVFQFGRYGDRNLVTGISGSQCPTCREGKSTTYGLGGFVSSRTDYNDNLTTYSYDDARGLEVSRTEASGTSIARTIATQWHPAYRLPVQIDEPGRRTTYAHDASGNVLAKTILDTITSESRTWTYTYNTYGQVLTVDGPRTDVSDVTTYTYYTCTTGFECGQLQRVTDALGRVTTFNTYNAHGQPFTITDPNGLVTTLTYDLHQRVTSRTVGTETTTFEYWPTGLLKKATLPDGSFIAYTYDAAHRLTELNDQEGNRVTYTLDAMGNRVREEVYDPASALTNTRSRVFNTLNRLTQEIGAANSPAVTTTLGYDSQGNEISVNAPLGRSTTQTYDPLNRLFQVTDPASGVTQYGYNALDQLISVTDPRNKVTSYTYNAFDEVTELVSPDTGTAISTYDLAGNLKTKTDARGATVTYSYDALNRLTEEVWSDQTIQYTYDQGPNALGRLSSVSDNSGQTSWTYDLQGRPVSRQQVMGGVSLGSSVSYDSAGRPSIVSYPSGHHLQFGYANGKVASITLDGSTPILTDVLYEPFGPVRGWTWGNNTLAAHGRDLDGKVEYIDSAGLRTYNYDDAFRITGITDAVDPALSQSYSYRDFTDFTGTPILLLDTHSAAAHVETAKRAPVQSRSVVIVAT